MAYATQKKRILVTVEGRINEKTFPICSHPGIIVIRASQRHEIEQAKLFTRFMLSGHRVKCKHAVTKLRMFESVRIERTSDGSLTEVSVTF